MTATDQPVSTDRTAFSYTNFTLFCVVVAATLIGIPLYGYYVGFALFDWILFFVMYIVTGLGITVGYHRLVSHRSFECPDWVKRIILIVGGWALQNSALIWCADHIRHHAKTDTDEDPYNASKGFWHSHCGWLFYETPHRTDKYEIRLRRDPVILWQHRYYWLIVLSGLVLPFALGLWWHGNLMGGISALLMGGLLRMFLVLNSTFTINSLCHMIGSQPHGTQDSSRDSWLISFVSFGEGYHNYHHTYARDYRNGPEWYNFDPSKWIIYTLSLFGLATNLRRLDPTVF
ncbi:MAG: fatty acid desaturase [Nitrospira sp.]|jgi:stearoyl-CoA desaturase (delta-9 desaturase)|nr:fatty acid desaturase [Nitrospira sp.]